MDDKHVKCICAIKEKAEIAEKSLGKFIAECMRWSDENHIHPAWMTESLYKVLCPTEDDYKDVVGTVVNDEGYFRWSCFDEYNRQEAQVLKSWKSTDFHFIGAALSSLINFGRNVVDPAFIQSVVPEIDFYTDATTVGSINFDTLPYNVGCPCFSHMRDKLPEDAYVGIVVSRDLYPDASAKALSERHMVIMPKGRALQGKPVTIKLSPYSEPQSSTTSWVTEDLDKMSNPGLIYIPERSLNKLPGVTFVTVNTVLPSHILDRYGLPTMEI